jgi:hypothetical protein
MLIPLLVAAALAFALTAWSLLTKTGWPWAVRLVVAVAVTIGLTLVTLIVVLSLSPWPTGE